VASERKQTREMEKGAVTNVKLELSRDHQDHDALLRHLAELVDAKRPPAEIRQCWLEFEENLVDHLETEERSLFSVAVQAHRLEIEKLRAEHRQIRQSLIGVSVSVELCTLKRSAIDELLTLLNAHVEHEERSLHHWLEEDEGILALRGVHAIRSRRERSSARLKAALKVGA